MFAIAGEAKWPTIKRSLITIYNDVYDEHLFAFAAWLSYYFVLSLFPPLVSMASLLVYVPIPHLFEGLLSLMAKLVCVVLFVRVCRSARRRNDFLRGKIRQSRKRQSSKPTYAEINELDSAA